MNDLLDSPLSPKNTHRFRQATVIIWCALLGLGLVFRIQHWPFASIMILGGSAGLSAYALSALIWLRGKNLPNTILSIAALIWIGVLIWGMLFNGGHPYNANGVLVFAGVFGVVFVIHVVINSMKERS